MSRSNQQKKEMGVIMKRKVRISFLTQCMYESMFFVEGDEFVLPLEDAIELVNGEVATIVYVYD